MGEASEVTAGIFALTGTGLGLVGGAGLEAVREWAINRVSSRRQEGQRLLEAASELHELAICYQSLTHAWELRAKRQMEPNGEAITNTISECNEQAASLRRSRLQLKADGPASAVPLIDEALDIVRKFQNAHSSWQLRGRSINEMEIDEAGLWIASLQTIGDTLVEMRR